METDQIFCLGFQPDFYMVNVRFDPISDLELDCARLRVLLMTIDLRVLLR